MKNCRRQSGRKTGCIFTSGGKQPEGRIAGAGRLPEENGKHGISGSIFLASALAAWFSLLPGGQARAEGLVVSAGTVIEGGGQTSHYDHFSWQMNQTLPSPDITFEGNSGGGVEARGGWRSVFLFDNTSAQGAEGAGTGTSNGLHFTASSAKIHSGFAAVIVNADTKAHGNAIELTDTALYGDWGNAIGALIATAGEISDNKITLTGGSVGSSQCQGVVLLGNVPFTRTDEEYVFTYGPGAAEKINGNTVEATGTKLTSANWGVVSVAAASQEASGNTFTLDFGDPDKTSADIETAGFSFISAGRMNSSLDNCDMPSAAAVSSDNVLTLKNGIIAAPVSKYGHRDNAYRGFFGVRADVQSNNTLNLENVTLESFQLPGSRDGIAGLSGRQISDSTVSVKDCGVWSMGTDSGSNSTNSSIVAIQGAMSMDKELGADPASAYTVSGSKVRVENSTIHSGGGVYGIAGDLDAVGRAGLDKLGRLQTGIRAAGPYGSAAGLDFGPAAVLEPAKVQADILAEPAEADGVGRRIAAGLNGDGAPLGGRRRPARADAGEALGQNAEVVEAPVRSVGGQIFVIAVVGVLDVGPQERDILHDLGHFIFVGHVRVESVAAGNDGQGNNNSEQNLCQVQANLLPFTEERA